MAEQVMMVNRRILQYRDGTPLMESVPRKIGQVKANVVRKHGLESHPVELMNAFWPFHNDSNGHEGLSVCM